MLLKEIRQACRLLGKNPVFTAIASVSLALGIGANSAIFSLTDAILLRPLQVSEPSRVLALTTETPSAPMDGVSYPDYRDIREQSHTLAGLAAFQLTTVGLSTAPNSLPQMRMGMIVSDNFFSLLGIQPALGRAFLPTEGQVTGRDAIVWLSHDFWATSFNRDPSVIGRRVRLNGVDFTIVGVMPPSFTGVVQMIRPAFYTPLTMAPRLAAANRVKMLEERDNRFFGAEARLKPGVSQK
ncbi:MAG TPA: ABC transporter permease, partial [Terriglobales bacterium]|nr:ABC transporter permease [Terriglobales bacterium]